MLLVAIVLLVLLIVEAAPLPQPYRQVALVALAVVLVIGLVAGWPVAVRR